MDISGKLPAVNSNPYVSDVRRSKRSKGPEKTESGVGIKGDRVSLSQTAREIQEAKKAIKSMPSVRNEKVQEIKQQLENGTYTIDSDKIATRMLTDVVESEILQGS